MAETQQCPRCAAELPREAPAGLCPRCLLSAGLPDSASDPIAVAETITVSTGDLDVPSTGTRIQYFGDYEIIDEIARGGMGVVYRARQVTLNRTVAVKMILTGQLASREEVQRFFTEAEAAASLQHPNIVTIHEVGEHEGQQYFSMEYVDGSSLAELVRQHPLGAVKAAEYVKTIAEAIHYAHEQGTLHRDLKPSNILIDESDQPQITDFGLAAKIEGDSELTASGTILGTPAYMPPEQAGARRALIGPASDVYSLGAVLYELLTGRPPFQAATPLDTLVQVLEQEPVSPKLLNAGIPDDLATICLKCLEKRPDGRYQTAEQLAEDLDRFLNQEPILARPASSLRKLWSFTKRRPWAVTAVASLIVMAALGLACYLLIENSFLRWQQTHPDYIPETGVITSRLKSLSDYLYQLWVVMFLGWALWNRYSGECRLKGIVVTTRLLTVPAALGTAGLAAGLYYIVQLIRAHVWENHFSFFDLLYAWPMYYFSGMILLQAIREFESQAFGDVPLELTDELREGIRKIFLPEDTSEEKGTFPGWEKRTWAKKQLQANFRIRKETGARPSEAKLAAQQIQMELHRQFPEKVPTVATLREDLTASPGFVLPLLLFSVPVFCLIAAAGTTGQPQILAGALGFACANGATLNYRGRHRRWKRLVLWVFLLQSAVFSTTFAVAFETITGLLIGAIAGCGYGCAIPYRLLAGHESTPAADGLTDSTAPGSSSPASNNPHST
ncbi:MAG TPA: serine/threonine protein kinase [Fuerstia sp.]|nr:serine/threonine protein kinase [Fuerstiella sp.]